MLGVGSKVCVVVVGQAHEDAGGRSGETGGVQAGVLDGLPRGLQQQPVLRVDRGGLALGDAEELRVERGRVVEEGTPLRHGAAGHPWLGVVVLLGVPPAGGNLGDEVIATEESLP